MKEMLIPIDQAGRIVLPKDVREELAIKPGDIFKVEVKGTAVTLTPNNETGGFVRKGKALVFTSVGQSVLTQATVDETASGEHEERHLRNSGAALRGSKMNKPNEKVYVEQRPTGDYAVRKANSERASAVEPTQKAAIGKAREMNPGVRPHVERVRNTDVGGRDKWRKA
jgi:AbrB family looped-hinge helix DNA binding protein